MCAFLSTSSSSFAVGSRCGLTRSELKEFHWVTEEGYCKALCGDGSKCGDPYAKHAAAGPALLSSPNSKSSSSSSDGSGEFSLKIHSPEIDGRTINIEVITRPPSKQLQQRPAHSSDGNAEMNARLRKLETQLEIERKQRDTLETELQQVMAQLHQTEQLLASAQGTTTDQGPSLMSRISAWRSPSRRGPSHTGLASTPATFAFSSALLSPPNTPPHPATTSAVSSPSSTQPMSPVTVVAASSFSSSPPQCPVCHYPIDNDLYEMVCGHSFHLMCARAIWQQQHCREETPFCIFAHCGKPVKHSPTKRLARIVEESSSRSNSDMSDPSHRSIGQTNPSLDRQSIGSQDTVVSQATTTSTSTESNQPQAQPQTNMTPNTVTFSSSSSSSSNSASTSTSAFTQEPKQPPTMDTSTANAPTSSSDA